MFESKTFVPDGPNRGIPAAIDALNEGPAPAGSNPPQEKEKTMTTQALPPSAALYQMAIGHYVSRALHLAAAAAAADLAVDVKRSRIVGSVCPTDNQADTVL